MDITFYFKAQCEWCGRVVSSHSEGFYIPDESMVIDYFISLNQILYNYLPKEK